MLWCKCRSFLPALLTVFAFMPGSVWALGLGEIDVESALNERFSARIELLDADGLQADEIIINMAAREDFRTHRGRAVLST